MHISSVFSRRPMPPPSLLRLFHNFNPAAEEDRQTTASRRHRKLNDCQNHHNNPRPQSRHAVLNPNRPKRKSSKLMKDGSLQQWSIATSVLFVTLAAMLLSTTTAFSATSRTNANNNDEVEPDNNSATGDGACENTDGNNSLDHYPRQEGNLLLHNFPSTASTQDEARKLVETMNIPDNVATVVVTAEEQTNGRGTSGRQWMGAKGNTFVTICIRQSAWTDTSLPMTLLPVRIGIIMAERINKLLKSCGKDQESDEKLDQNSSAMTTIKWPNDVLVDEHKISGVLIETSNNYWFLIGIGVNVAHAPIVPSSGPNHGRTATSIASYCPNILEQQEEKVRLARQLGEDMAGDLSSWLSDHKGSNPNQSATEKAHILNNWKQWVNWDMKLVLRDTGDREIVTPVDIEPDGRLRVRGSNGQERLIVTDYFL